MAKTTTGLGASGEEEKKKITKETLRRGLRIFRYVRPYRMQFLIGLSFLLLSSLTSLVFPLVTGRLVDSAVLDMGPGMLDNINLIALGLFGVFVLQAIFAFFRVYFLNQVSEKAVASIRQALYSKFVRLPITFYEKRRVGEITSRITSDVAQVHDSFSYTLAELFRQVVVLLGGVVIILVSSVKLSLFMLGTFPLLVLLALLFGRKIKKLSRETQDELAATNVIVEETMQGIQVVKAFTNEGYEINRYKTSLSKVVRLALHAAYYRGAFVSFVIVGLFGGVTLVIWYGASLVQAGELTIGELFSFILYTVFIGASVGGLGDLYGKIQASLGATDRILEILDEAEEPSAREAALSAAAQPRLIGDIAYENVVFTYPTRPDITVLKGVSFRIRSGEKIALVGPSGAGKSTIAQLLMKFYEVSGGRITVDGTDLREYNLASLRQNIGIVPQEVLLFGGTIRENIAYGRPGAADPEIVEAAVKANAFSFISSFPEGLDTVVGERGVKLSGGQRQRIAIARAILKDPSILILDEATSSLDSESEKLVQEAMDELMKDRTTIIIAHRLATIRKADKILVIDNGRIAEQGSHDDLSLQDQGLYAHLLKLQFELN
ncbi:ABC transporter transmembrane domain-containing protein [soil metagenome]